jgi:hypothetical protein
MSKDKRVKKYFMFLFFLKMIDEGQRYQTYGIMSGLLE